MDATRRLFAALLVIGFAGHLYAAHAIGGSGEAYLHHIAGFAVILVVTGGLLALLGRLFWRARPTATWVVIGAVQAAFGAWMALDPVGSITG